MPKGERHFDAKLFRFLNELAVNNDRTWFKANKERYEQEVKDPFLRFIADFAPHLEKITKHAVADPRGVGGSFFRIHRDTRFSKDKTPYKTHASAQFRHARGKDVHAPGFYLHLEPSGCFAGAGIWRPASDALREIRGAIVADPKKYQRLVAKKSFTADWSMSGERLSRPPRGFDKEHPLIEELKRKDFIAVTEFKQREVCSPGFMEIFAKRCKAAAALNCFLAEALDLPW